MYIFLTSAAAILKHVLLTSLQYSTFEAESRPIFFVWALRNYTIIGNISDNFPGMSY